MSDSSAQSWAAQLISRMPSGLLVLSGDLRVLQANPALSAISSLDPPGIIGRHLGEVMSIEGIEERALDVLESGEALEGLHYQWQRGDELRHLEISICAAGASSAGDEGALLLFVEDITEQEALRARARLSERGFRQVIEHSPDGIGVHRDNKFLYVNPAFVHLMGVERPGEIIGRHVYDFVHPDEHAALQDRVKRMLTEAEKVPVRETRLLRSDGSQWVADLTARRVIFDGEPAIVSIARDITERKRLTAQMMQMDRMIAAGTLAAGVGHEINNPLTYVAANIDFTLERIAEIEPALASVAEPSVLEELGVIFDALGDASEGSGRIRDIVSQLRTFSPGEESTRTTFAIGPVVESVRGMVANEIRHRAKLVMEIDDKPLVWGNANKLGQVFLNLLINAAHAIEEGAHEDNEIRVRTRADDTWVTIEVRDTGSGISSEELPRIFDPFFTTKPVGQGTGLGLYICQRIVESHGGRIEVQSEPGEGTAVGVQLPRVQKGHTPQTGAERDDMTTSRRARVLVIDDEPMIGQLVTRILGAAHDVTALVSAHKALDLLGEETFDLILCDLMMPDITGMDFHARVSERYPKLVDSIVFITGGAFTPRAIEFLENTSNESIEKPVEVKRLRELIHKRLEKGSTQA